MSKIYCLKCWNWIMGILCLARDVKFELYALRRDVNVDLFSKSFYKMVIIGTWIKVVCSRHRLCILLWFYFGKEGDDLSKMERSLPSLFPRYPGHCILSCSLMRMRPHVSGWYRMRLSHTSTYPVHRYTPHERAWYSARLRGQTKDRLRQHTVSYAHAVSCSLMRPLCIV